MRTHTKRRFADFAAQASVFVATLLFVSPHVAAVAFVIGLYARNG